MNGWVTVVVHCEECGKTFASSVPATWDGSPIQCIECGDLATEVAERG